MARGLGDRLLSITDNAHLLGLERITGAQLRDALVMPVGVMGCYGC